MTHGLTAEQAERCGSEGFVFPITVMTSEEAESYHQLYNEALHHDAGRGGDVLKLKGHLVLKWMADLARHPRILDPVESVLGPNILCWTSTFFVKQPGDQTYVS